MKTIVRNLTFSMAVWFGVSWLLARGLGALAGRAVDVWLVFALVLVATIFYYRLTRWTRGHG